MCRISPLRVTVVACFAVLSFASTVVHPSPAKSQSQEIWAAYWSAEPGWHTDLQIRNNYGKQDLTVQPVLKLADGSEIPLPSVTMAASDNEVVDLNAAVAAAAPTLSPSKAYGSIVVRFISHTSQNAFVNVMLHRMGQPIAFHFDGWGLDPVGQAGYESLWWLPLPTTQGLIVIANPTANATTAQVRVSAPDGSFAARTITLMAGESARLSVRDVAPDITSASQFGGLTVIPSGTGTLLVNAIEYDDDAGLGVNLTVYGRGVSGQTGAQTLRAPMVALTQPAQELSLPVSATFASQVFVRNTTAHPVAVAHALNWKSPASSGTASYPALTLTPGETRRIALSADDQLPPAANWATVALTYNGADGDVVAVSASYTPDLKYGAQSPFSTEVQPAWEGSRWVVDATHNSLITAGNGGSKPTRLGVTIVHAGGAGKYEMPPRSLAPGEQAWIDMAQLIRNQVPDANGQTIPVDVTSGTYELRDLGDPYVGAIYEGKLTIDKTFGTAAYGCSACCGNSGATLDPISFTGPPDDQVNYTVDAEDCQGYGVTLTSGSFNWGTNNPGISSVSFAHANVVGVGSTQNFSSVTYHGLGYHCPLVTTTPIGNFSGQPIISGPHDVWWFGGENPGEYPISITLQSDGGEATTWGVTAGFEKVNINPTGSTVTITSSGSAFSSAPGDVTITAQSNGVTSLPFHITTHKPASSFQTAAFTSCDATWGYETDISYSVEDQLQSPLSAGITWNEKWSTPVTHVYPNENWGRPLEIGGTNPNQYLTDIITGPGVNNDPPNVPPTACPGAATEVQYWGQEFRVGTLVSGNGVLVNSHNLVRYTDHAEHQ